MIIQLLDGTNGQCCINFRSDGPIALTSGTINGAVLDTYTGAATAPGVWFVFEIEIVIHNTAGSWAVRKNGNTVNDRALGSLNTRGGSTNNYANKIQVGIGNNWVNTQVFDDILWRSDATSLPWLGDIRCYTRMPATDASIQFTKSPTTLFAQQSAQTSDHTSASANNIRAVAVVSPVTGALASLSFNFNAALTGNAKMALYDATGSGGNPNTLLASSTELTNPGIGVISFPVTAGPTVTKGVTYWVAIWSDAAITPTGNGAINNTTTATYSLTYTTSFPALFVSGSVNQNTGGMGSQGMNVTPFNAGLVSETAQDGTTTYVYHRGQPRRLLQHRHRRRCTDHHHRGDHTRLHREGRRRHPQQRGAAQERCHHGAERINPTRIELRLAVSHRYHRSGDRCGMDADGGERGADRADRDRLMAAHRYWRISPTASAGGAYSFSEIQFRITAGVSLVFSGGTASAADTFGGAPGTYDASKAADSNTATLYSSNNKTAPQW